MSTGYFGMDGPRATSTYPLTSNTGWNYLLQTLVTTPPAKPAVKKPPPNLAWLDRRIEEMRAKL